MRHTFITLAGGALTLLLVGAASTAQADIIAQDDASDAVYSGGGNYNGLNGGTGFLPWIVTPAVSDNTSGAFIGDATKNAGGAQGANGVNINSSGAKSFSLYANDFYNGIATRPLATALAVGQTFSLDFDNGYVDNGATAGFQFGNASTGNGFYFYFQGGANNYRISDVSSTGAGRIVDTPLGFTGSGLHADFTLTAPTQYKFTLRDINSSAAPYTTTGYIGSSSVDRIIISDYGAGGGTDHNVYANHLAVTTPAPSALLPMASGMFVLFGAIQRRKRK